MKNNLYILFILFLFLCPLSTSASALQDLRISMQQKVVPLSKVFEEIEAKTGYSFLVRNNDVNTNEKVSIDVKNKTVEEILQILFAGKNIKFQVDGKRISVFKPQAVSQQKRRVTGQVLDAMREPVIGASVMIAGTANGCITDIDGNFSLDVADAGVKLQISYIGYKPQTVQVGDKTSFKITLQEDTRTLDEVVVVGYGSQTKVNLTGSVASISNAELAERPITSVASGIQGLVPGVTITSGEGRPGQDGATIRVRGQGTLNNSDPYILIDGIESGSMNQVDPNDIESISILKDAASAAIYGSKAANGVVLITTKRGKSGRPVLSYSGSVGWQAATGFIERMNSADAATYYNRALANSGKAPRFTDAEIQKFRDGSEPYKYPNTDWNDLGYQGSGFMHQHNVSISGGNESVKYMTSAGYLGQEGIMKNSGRKQFNIRSNVDITLSKQFAVRTNLAYINNAYSDANNSYVGGGSDQIIRQLNRIAPWIVYKYEDGTYGTIGDGNPIAWLDSGETIDRRNQNFSGILSVDYNIIDGLKLTAQGSYVTNIQDYDAFVKDIQYNPDKYHGPNKLDSRTYLWNRSSFDGLLNYDKTFGKHTLKALAGYRVEQYNYKESKATRTGFPNNDMTDINAGTESTQTNNGYKRELTMMSYFGRVNYDFMGKYLFEANFRADASSRFSPDNRWGYFPSVSAGWRISEEAFMAGTRHWLESLKIRGSWGQLGNQDALNSDKTSDYYPWLVTYSIGKNYPFDGVVNTGIAQTAHKLASISWEKSTTWGVGLDLTVLQGLNISVDYYNRKTDGIIMEVPVPGSFGLSPYKDNVGAMRNQGVEVTAGYQKSWNDWRFGANGNFTLNRNKILDLGGVKEMIDGYYINRVGSAFKSFYAYVADGLFQSQEEADAYTEKYGNPFGKKFKAGDIRYKDDNKDGKLTSADRQVVNSEQPKFTFGLNLSVGWKGFDLSVLMQGACGVSRYFNQEVFGDFTGDTSHPSTAWFDAWSPENPNGKFPYVAEAGSSPSQPSTYSTFWVFTTNYLRFKNIQFGYTLPSTWLRKTGITRAKIYYSGENLFKIDSLPVDIDPEAPSGRGSHYPQVSTNSIGINLTF